MAQIAVITGGSRGIGAATARRMASDGWDVAISYATRAEEAERVVRECREFGVRAEAIRADVGRDDDVVNLFHVIDEQLGTLRALVNNAGIVGPKARVDALDSTRIALMFAVNVVGAFGCAREAVRRMSTAVGGMGGVIVNVSSAAARIGSPGEYVDYAASKGAVDTLTLGLAKEVAMEGIRVNGVRPGIIRTEIHASGGQPDRIERIAPMVPMQRAGEADEVAAAIAWLCCDEASYVTGAILDVSGGR